MVQESKYISMVRGMLSKNVSFIFYSTIVIADRQEAKKMGMINAWLEDKQYEGRVENPVFILFKPPDMGRFRLFYEEEKKKGRGLVDDYDYPGGYVMLVYSFPLREDYKTILKGRYSELSEEYRKMLPSPIRIELDTAQYNDLDPKDRFIESPGVWAILNRNVSLRKDWEDVIGMLPGNGEEYYPIPNMIKETFSWNEFSKE